MAIFFKIDDEYAATRVLQERLRAISRTDSRIPPVFIDGIYGRETENAVYAFQRAYGISPTGEMDIQTHRAIETAYAELKDAAWDDPTLPSFDKLEGGVISPDDEFGAVFALQALLRSVGEQDDRFNVTPNGVYDAETLTAVTFFQSLLGRETDGKVDASFWRALSEFAARPFDR